jgi:hypothetical protein
VHDKINDDLTTWSTTQQGDGQAITEPVEHRRGFVGSDRCSQESSRARGGTLAGRAHKGAPRRAQGRAREREQRVGELQGRSTPWTRPWRRAHRGARLGSWRGHDEQGAGHDAQEINIASRERDSDRRR